MASGTAIPSFRLPTVDNFIIHTYRNVHLHGHHVSFSPSYTKHENFAKKRCGSAGGYSGWIDFTFPMKCATWPECSLWVPGSDLSRVGTFIGPSTTTVAVLWASTEPQLASTDRRKHKQKFRYFPAIFLDKASYLIPELKDNLKNIPLAVWYSPTQTPTVDPSSANNNGSTNIRCCWFCFRFTAEKTPHLHCF